MASRWPVEADDCPDPHTDMRLVPLTKSHGVRQRSHQSGVPLLLPFDSRTLYVRPPDNRLRLDDCVAEDLQELGLIRPGVSTLCGSIPALPRN